MSLIQMDYASNALKTQVSLKIYLPVDVKDGETGEYDDIRPFRTLYLLHGMFGSNGDWLNHTLLLQYLRNTNIAVVMPYAQNSFYVNNSITEDNYATFIGEELVNMTRNTFPLSTETKDTYIAGLSMGGFGAFSIALKYPKTFSVVGCFSPAFISELIDVYDDTPKNIYGVRYTDLIKAQPQDFDVNYMIENATHPLPNFFISCGTQDELIEPTRNVVKKLVKKGANVAYFEEDFGHSWDLWDMSIARFVDMLRVY